MSTGKTYSTKYLLDSNNNRGSEGQILSTTSTGIDWVDANSVPGTGLWVTSGNNIYNSNSGNVGIGTDSPSNPLHVYSSDNILATFESTDGISEIRIKDNTKYTRLLTVGSHFKIMPNDGVEMAVFEGDTGITHFNGGNVGIGTASPSKKLEVNGSYKLGTNAYIQYDATYPYTINIQNTASAGDIKLQSANGENKILLQPSTGGIDFYTNNSERMRITDGGNVGIGTTSPNANAKLHLYNSASATDVALRLTSNANSKTLIGFGDTVDQTAGAIKYDNATSEMSFEVLNSTEAMRIDSDGNVGIGTTSPGYKLDVNGSVNTAFGATNGYRINTNRVLSQVSGGFEIGVLDYKTTYPNISFNNDNTFRVQQNGSTRIIVNSSGNVGIGTTSPSQKLHVKGNILVEDNDSTDIVAQIGNSGDDGWVNLYANGTSTAFIGSNAVSYLNGGNVGIGTTAPDFKLDVAGDIGMDGKLYHNGDHNTYISFTADTQTFRTGGSDRVSINNTGVGIGTTSPSYRLTAYGSSTNSEIVASFGSGNDENEYTAIGLSGFIASNGATKAGLALKRTSLYGTGELHFLNNNTTDNSDMTLSDSKMMIDSSGNVGIGTTSPGSKLEVSSGVGANGDSILTISADTDNSTSSSSPKLLMLQKGGTKTSLIEMDSSDRTHFSNATGYYFSGGNVGIGTTSPAVKLDFGSATGKAFHLYTSGTDYYGFNMLQYDSGPFSTNIFSGNGGDIKLRTASGTSIQSTRLTVKSGGNVGIGTSSPNAKLNVNGNIKIEGTNSLSFGGSASIPSWAINSSGNDLIINDQATTSGDVLFTNDGSVGIGTTSPSQKLDVNGVVQSDRFFVGTNTAPSQWAVQVRNNNSTADSGIYFNNNSSEIYLRNSSNVIGARIRSNSASYFNGGDVGIGTASPQERLHVSGETHPSIKLSSSSDGNYNVILNCGYRNEALNLSVGGYKVFTTEGFNTPETTHLYSNNSKALSLASNQAATFTSTVTATNFINSSDERLKENIEEVRDNNVEVNWKTFNFKTEKEQKRYGVIAQELEKTNPEFVREDSQGFKSVAYIDLLIAKIAELEARIQKLEK